MKKVLFLLMAAGILFACQSAQDKMEDTAKDVGEKVENAADKAMEAGGEMMDKAGEMAASAVESMTESYDDFKMALGDAAMALDTESSVLNWSASKITGAKHEGTINFAEGMMTMADGKASGVFTIDMSSITNTDLEGEDKQKLEGHLSSGDFFDVENNPRAMLIIKDAEVGEGGAINTKAKLTIKGVDSYPMVTGNISDKVANVSMTFDRTNHDIKYGSGKFFEDLGDKVINDDVVVNGTLTFK